MVKGVNKTVIEVNNTGSRLFEKIVFYVTPEYGNLSAKQLKRAASAFTFQYEDFHPSKGSLRSKVARKRKRKMLLLAGGLLLAACVVTALIIIL